jgi:hypothetical protein
MNTQLMAWTPGPIEWAIIIAVMIVYIMRRKSLD